MTARRIAAIALLALAPLAACGGDDDPLTEAELAEELGGEDGVDEATADCIAAYVFDNLDEDELDKLTAGSLDDDEAPSPEIEEVLTTAIGECLTGDLGGEETDDASGTVEEGTAVEVPAEICDSYTAWEQSGDTVELSIVQGFVQESGMTEAADAADFLLSEPATETADEQAAYEGAVDVLRGELSASGCAFS